MQNNRNQIYEGGAYYRLSKDDFHSQSYHGNQPSLNVKESNSIKGQRELVRNYLKDRDNIHLAGEYEDDGFTGLNFERPGFRRMMEDVRSGKINCVIVKDFSRFGRDHIETGRYLKKVFPKLNIRFIAINEDFDSLGQMKQSDQILVPFKNLMNDNYSRDISIKVRSHLEVKCRNGEYIGAFPVYGYQKKEDDHNQLVIDPQAAAVVEDMFDMVLTGYSLQGIAVKLNKEGILSPLEYKRYKGSRYYSCFKTSEKAQWTHTSVRRIVMNEVYTGVLEQGKVTKINYKTMERIRKSKEEWIRADHMHEAIIDRNTFDLVQDLLARDTRSGAGKEKLYLFSGMLRCADCCQWMVRKSERHKGKPYIYYVCPTNKKNKEKCHSHRISVTKLEAEMTEFFKNYTKILLEFKELVPKLQSRTVICKKIEKLRMNQEILDREYEETNQLKVSLYSDCKSGLLEEEEYQSFKAIFGDKLSLLDRQRKNMEQQIADWEREDQRDYTWVDRALKFSEGYELTRMCLVMNIRQIFVYRENRLQIELLHQDVFDDLLENGEAYQKTNESYVVERGCM